MYDCHLRGEGMHGTPGAGGCSSGRAGCDELEAREAKYHGIDSPNPDSNSNLKITTDRIQTNMALLLVPILR